MISNINRESRLLLPGAMLHTYFVMVVVVGKRGWLGLGERRRILLLIVKVKHVIIIIFFWHCHNPARLKCYSSPEMRRLISSGEFSLKHSLIFVRMYVPTRKHSSRPSKVKLCSNRVHTYKHMDDFVTGHVLLYVVGGWLVDDQIDHVGLGFAISGEVEMMMKPTKCVHT